MTYIKINDKLYPTISIDGFMIDHQWNGRSSKSITLEMDILTAKELFTNDLNWSIVSYDIENIYGVDEVVIDTRQIANEYDNSEYSVAGDIIDHRDGTVTVKMGTPTDSELLTMLLEGLEL